MGNLVQLPGELEVELYARTKLLETFGRVSTDRRGTARRTMIFSRHQGVRSHRGWAMAFA